MTRVTSHAAAPYVAGANVLFTLDVLVVGLGYGLDVVFESCAVFTTCFRRAVLVLRRSRRAPLMLFFGLCQVPHAVCGSGVPVMCGAQAAGVHTCGRPGRCWPFVQPEFSVSGATGTGARRQRVTCANGWIGNVNC